MWDDSGINVGPSNSDTKINDLKATAASNCGSLRSHTAEDADPSSFTPGYSVNRRAYYRGLQEGRPQPLPYADFETSLQPGGVRLVVCLLESAPELTGLAEEATRDILGALPEGACAPVATCHGDDQARVSVVRAWARTMV